jgi:hypothetical protein
MDYRFATEFVYKNDRVNDAAQELNIRYDDRVNSLSKLITFAKTYKDKNINVMTDRGVREDFVKSIPDICPNVRVCLYTFNHGAVELLKSNHCKFYFGPLFPAYNWSMLNSLISIGVTDVYIADDLCYDLDDVKSVCSDANVSIRCVLNRIPSTTPYAGNDFKSFIYRPEDMDLLSKYYDIFEFDCGTPYDKMKFDVLSRVFFEQGKWNGDIREINDDIGYEFNDNLLLPELTRYKTVCKRHCDSHSPSFCHKCYKIVNDGQKAMSKTGIIFK